MPTYSLVPMGSVQPAPASSAPPAGATWYAHEWCYFGLPQQTVWYTEQGTFISVYDPQGATEADVIHEILMTNPGYQVLGPYTAKGGHFIGPANTPPTACGMNFQGGGLTTPTPTPTAPVITPPPPVSTIPSAPVGVPVVTPSPPTAPTVPPPPPAIIGQPLPPAPAPAPPIGQPPMAAPAPGPPAPVINLTCPKCAAPLPPPPCPACPACNCALAPPSLPNMAQPVEAPAQVPCPQCGAPVTVNVPPPQVTVVDQAPRAGEFQADGWLNSDGSWRIHIDRNKIPEFNTVVTNLENRLIDYWREEETTDIWAPVLAETEEEVPGITTPEDD